MAAPVLQGHTAQGGGGRVAAVLVPLLHFSSKVIVFCVHKHIKKKSKVGN